MLRHDQVRGILTQLIMGGCKLNLEGFVQRYDFVCTHARVFVPSRREHAYVHRYVREWMCARAFDRSLRSLDHSSVRSFVRSFLPCFLRSLVRLFARSFRRSFMLVLVRSFFRSYQRVRLRPYPGVRAPCEMWSMHRLTGCTEILSTQRRISVENIAHLKFLLQKKITTCNVF